MIRDKTNFCRLKSLLWQTAFYLLLSQANQFGSWNFVQLDTLEAPALQLTEYSNFCCSTQKRGREQSAPYQDKWLMTGGVMTFMSYNPLEDADARTPLFGSSIVLLKRALDFRFAFWSSDAYLCFANFL